MLEPIYRDEAGKPVKLIYEAVLEVKPAAGPAVAVSSTVIELNEKLRQAKDDVILQALDP